MTAGKTRRAMLADAAGGFFLRGRDKNLSDGGRKDQNTKGQGDDPGRNYTRGIEFVSPGATIGAHQAMGDVPGAPS
jgi:hypothetical protein